jgi:hypothetical protein
MTQLQPSLGEQGLQRTVQRVAHEVVLAFLSQVGRAQAHREQGRAQAGHDVRHRFR